ASAPVPVLPHFDRGHQHNRLGVIRPDSTLDELWQVNLNIDRSTILVGGLADDTSVPVHSHSVSTKAFELIRMDHDDGQYRTYNVNGFIRFSATEFRVTKQALLIGGYFNRVPLVLYYDLATRQSRILPGLLNEDGELTQVKVFED